MNIILSKKHLPVTFLKLLLLAIILFLNGCNDPLEIKQAPEVERFKAIIKGDSNKTMIGSKTSTFISCSNSGTDLAQKILTIRSLSGLHLLQLSIPASAVSIGSHPLAGAYKLKQQGKQDKQKTTLYYRSSNNKNYAAYVTGHISLSHIPGKEGELFSGTLKASASQLYHKDKKVELDIVFNIPIQGQTFTQCEQSHIIGH